MLEMVPEMLKGVADDRFEPFLGRSFVVDPGVADHKQVLHSHLEAADIDCNGMGLSVGVGMMGGDLLHLFYGHDQGPFGGFAVAVAVAAVVVGTSEPVSAVVGHIEAAVAVLAAVVVAVVEVVIAAAVAGCIVVVADGTAAAEGSHMVAVGC